MDLSPQGIYLGVISYFVQAMSLGVALGVFLGLIYRPFKIFFKS